MRTADPKDTRQDFLDALKDVRTTFISSNASNIPDPSKKLVAEYSFVAAAVLLEGFLSDLFVAYISADSATFRTYLQKDMTIQSSNEHATRAKSLVQIELSHPTQPQIRSILDSRDFNVTFETVGDMKACAGKWLSSGHKKCFQQLTKHHSATLTAAKRVRNFLAHRNDASKKQMQKALADPDLPEYMRQGKHNISDVGSFLQATRTGDFSPRLVLHLDSLDSIANTLCP